MKTAAKAIIAYVAIVAATVLGLAFSAQAAPGKPAPVHTVSSPATPAPAPAPVKAAPVKAQCEEDEPCWDCHTMGNHQCGPATPAPVKAAPVTAPVAAPAAPAAAPVKAAPVQHAAAPQATAYAPVKAAPVKAAPAPVKAPVKAAPKALQCGFYSADHSKLWNDPSMKYTRDVLTSEHTTATYMGSIKGTPEEPAACKAIPAGSALTIADADNRWDYYLLTKTK